MEAITHQLPGIQEVAPLSEEDHNCFAEIRGILEKYGNLQRFGVCLLHQHFDLAEDEVLTESWDPERRLLISKPAKRGRSPELIETSWRLDTGECRADCHPRPDGGHYSD